MSIQFIVLCSTVELNEIIGSGKGGGDSDLSLSTLKLPVQPEFCSIGVSLFVTLASGM